MTDVWAIVPIKPLNRAKSRLAPVLEPDQREKLALGMMQHVLTVLTQSPHLGGVLVISRDMKALAEARQISNVQTLQESGTPELNQALLRASEMLISWGIGATLIIPADIPLVSVEDIESIVKMGMVDRTVVLSADRQLDGTNALFLRPPNLMDFGFGRGSFQRHREHAEQEQLNWRIYKSDRLALDVDTPEDLTYYLELTKEQGIAPIDYQIKTLS